MARAFLVTLLASEPGCLAAEPGLQPPASLAAPQTLSLAPQAPIGIATMEADGTIRLQLRAIGSGAVGPGALGDALLRYGPGDPGYASVRDHFPALRPGVTLPVPPFP